MFPVCAPQPALPTARCTFPGLDPTSVEVKTKNSSRFQVGSSPWPGGDGLRLAFGFLVTCL